MALQRLCLTSPMWRNELLWDEITLMQASYQQGGKSYLLAFTFFSLGVNIKIYPVWCWWEEFLPNLWGKETESSILSNAWPDSPSASRETILGRSMHLAPGHGRHTAVQGWKACFPLPSRLGKVSFRAHVIKSGIITQSEAAKIYKMFCRKFHQKDHTAGP